MPTGRVKFFDDDKGFGFIAGDEGSGKRLAKELGGVNAVKRADLDALKALSWLPDEVAENVFRALHRPGG